MTERKDALGDRMKAYEHIETSIKFPPNSLIYARLDGRSFSKFTRGLARPWDARMIELMGEVTKSLVKEFNCTIGYTQSDEISLLIENSYDSPMIFDGKKQKIVSTLAAHATSAFVAKIPEYLPEKIGKFPTFDCRAFVMPNETEAMNAFMWREYDATKNSISMLAQHYFSHKELLGVSGKVKIDMLKTQKDVDWEWCPDHFKYGTYYKRVQVTVPSAEAELGYVIRSRVMELEDRLCEFADTESRVSFIMNGM